MSRTLGTEYKNIEDRRRFLKDNCDSVELMGYMKPFEPEKIDEMKTELSEVSIEINDIEEEKKAVSEGFKLRLDPLIVERKRLLHNIKQKAEYVKETVYKFIDHENKTVEFYNEDGTMISMRPATADEAQKTIFQIERTGTDN